MVSMFPLKISNLLQRPVLPQATVGPLRPRLAAAESPVSAVEAGRPEQERRMTANRRVSERRENEQAAFLDTRIGKSRRRSAGRRAEDQQQRITISIKA